MTFALLHPSLSEMRLLFVLTLLASFAFAKEAFAQEAKAEPSVNVEATEKVQKKAKKNKSQKTPVVEEAHQAPATPIERRAERLLEDTRQRVADRVLRLSDSIDALFGDKRADDKSNTSTLRIGQRFYYRNGDSGVDSPEATLNLYLPNLKKIEDKLKKSISDTFDNPETSVTEVDPKKYNEMSDWDLNQESGIVVANPINYYARVRLRKDFLTQKFSQSYYIETGWSKRNEWEQKMALTSDYAISRDLLYRFLNEQNWGMTNLTFGTVHGPSFIYEISETSAISYDLRLYTATENNLLYGNRGSVSSTFRMQLPLEWIYIEVMPELAWERQTNFKPLYNFFFKLELYFGKI